MLCSVYSNLEKEVRMYFTGDEDGAEMRLKVVKLKRDLRTRIKSEVAAYLEIEPSVSEAVFCILHNHTTRPTQECPTCKREYGPAKFYSVKDGYHFHDHCSTKCRSRNPQYQEKIAATNLEKYGHVNNMWGDGVRDKTKAKWVEVYGVDQPMKTQAVQEKSKATNMEKLGVEFPAQDAGVREKYRATMLETYGVDNSLHTGTARATCLARYGVEYPMQSPEIQAKQQSYKRKTGTWPSGNEYTYQGFEDMGINTLLASGLTEDQIVISNTLIIPTITYFNPVKNKDCRYFPDIFIPHENRLIEIKSEYTMRAQKEENMAKQYASTISGFRHEIWVYSRKGELLEIIK